MIVSHIVRNFECNYAAHIFRFKCKISTVAVIIGLLLIVDHAAATEFHYDPSRCKADAQGKLFIALERHVLAVPNEGPMMLGRFYPGTKDEPLPAPDPAEPVGCPDNPNQLMIRGFMYRHQAPQEAQFGVDPASTLRVNFVTLMRVGQVGTPSWPGMQWNGEDVNLQVARSACTRASVREQLANGLEACRVKQSRPNVRIEDWAASYIARPDIYQSPLGNPFSIYCGPNLFTGFIGDCKVSYVLLPGLGITYRFQPYGNSPHLPIERVIEFDRGLRAALESALVRDYKWPEQHHNVETPRSTKK